MSVQTIDSRAAIAGSHEAMVATTRLTDSASPTCLTASSCIDLDVKKPALGGLVGGASRQTGLEDLTICSPREAMNAHGFPDAICRLLGNAVMLPTGVRLRRIASWSTYALSSVVV